MGRNRFKQFLHALIAEKGTSEHEKRRDDPWDEMTEYQGHRKQDHKLVAQRPCSDLADDRQFALCSKPENIAGCNRSIVDDDAGGLHAGLGSLTSDIV